MNILVLNHNSGIGGAARSLIISAKVLLNAGHRLHVLSPKGPLVNVLSKMGARVTVWTPPACYWLCGSLISTAHSPFSLSNLLSLVRLPFIFIMAGLLIRRIVAKESIDAVYVNSIVLFCIGMLLKILRRHRKIKVIWHIREVINSQLPISVHSWVIRSITGCADEILAITTNEAKAFKGWKVTVVHNTVESSWLDGPGQPAPVSPQRVCMSASFQPGKGILDFLAMARILVDRIPDVTCVLYTTTPSGGRIDNLLYRLVRYLSPTARLLTSGLWKFREISLDQRIVCFLDCPMTRAEYDQCYVYVRADETGSPWGRDIIEAMYTGLPIVATGSYEEFVIHGSTGFLVPPGRPDLMADFVERLLRDPELRTRMSVAAALRAEELFAPKIYEEKLLKAFV